MGNIFFPSIRSALHCNLLQWHCKLKSVVGITSRDASCDIMLLADDTSLSLKGMLPILITRVAIRVTLFLTCNATALHEKLKKVSLCIRWPKSTSKQLSIIVFCLDFQGVC